MRRAAIGAALLWVGALAGAGTAAAQLPAFAEIPNSPFDNAGMEASSLTFSPSGAFVANTSNGNVSMYSVAPGGDLTAVPGSPFFATIPQTPAPISQSVAFSPSGGLIALANYNLAYVVVFQVDASGALHQVASVALDGTLRSVAFSPDGSLLAIARTSGVTGVPPEVTMFSVGAGGTLTNKRDNPLPTASQAQSVAFSPGGTLLAVANGTDNTVSTFSVAPDGTLSNRTETTLPASSNPLSVRFSPNGTLLAVGNLTSSIVSVFSVGSDGALSDRRDTSVLPNGNGPSSLAFSPGGTLLATGNRNSNNLSVFSVAPDGTLTPVSGSPFALRAASNPLSVTFSPKEVLLASGNGAATKNMSVLAPPAALELAKRASADHVAPGHVLKYTVTLRNVSNAFPATGPVVDDLTGVLDKAALVGTPTASTGTVTVDAAAKTLTWDGTVAPGETVTIRYAVRVDAALDGGVLADRVSGPPGSSCDMPPGPPADPCATETPVLRPPPPPPPPPPEPPPSPPRADLVLSKAASADTAHPGGQVLYTLVVRNHGPDDATGVTVVDPTPPGLFLLAAEPSQGSCEIVSEQLSCALGTVATGGEALVLVTATVAQNATGTVLNLASVFADQADPDASNNTADTAVQVTPLPPLPNPDPGQQPVSNFVVAKHVDRTHAVAGQTLTYTVRITNRGPDTAHGVSLTDASAIPLKVISVRPSQGSCLVGPPIECALGTLRVGAHATVTVVAAARTPGRQINTVAGTSHSWDPDPSASVAAAHTTVVPPPPPTAPPPVTGRG